MSPSIRRPTEIAEMTVLAAEEIRALRHRAQGGAPVSFSNFGSRDAASSLKMRAAAAILSRSRPTSQFDGEMHADTALSEALRQRVFPHAELEGRGEPAGLPRTSMRPTSR